MLLNGMAATLLTQTASERFRAFTLRGKRMGMPKINKFHTATRLGTIHSSDYSRWDVPEKKDTFWKSTFCLSQWSPDPARGPGRSANTLGVPIIDKLSTCDDLPARAALECRVQDEGERQSHASPGDRRLGN